MKKVILSVATLMCISGISNAQDVHFTQYFTSPMTLNPAQTGLTPADYRVSANYRSQWYSVSDHPYTTGTIGFDLPILRNKLPEGDALGVGVMGLYDRAGAGALQNVTAGLSVAYHHAFGAQKQHTISLGVQGALVQKSVDFSKLVFESQIHQDNPDLPADLPSGESQTNADVSYPDFNVGLLYSGRLNDNSTVYAGFSYYHLTQPTERFLNSGSANKLSSRYTAYLGGSLNLNENTVAYISGMYQKQGPAWEALVGGAVGFVLNPGHDEYAKNTTFYLGAWYRYGDAIAPYVGFEFSKMQIGISYDVNVSGFTNATGGQGAYEFSVIYNGVFSHNFNRKYNFACPKF